VAYIYLTSVLIFTACNINESPNLSNPEELESYLSRKYKKLFDLNIQYPAYVYSEQNSRYTSTAYYEGKLYRLYVQEDGSTLPQVTTPVLPVGNIRVLSIIIDYPSLEFGEILNTLWREAQDSINDDHKKWADQLNLNQPLVQFVNQNLLIEPQEISEASTSSLTIIANEYGYQQNDYDIIAFLDLNQEEPSGGFAVRKFQWVKIGWFYNEEQGTELTPSKLRGIAYAIYHHEIGHLFGWDHEWSDAVEGELFITDPELFGWEDIDHDGVPEIMDSTPYGIN